MYIPSSLLVSVALFWRGALAESSFSQPPPGGPAGNFQDNPSYDVGEKIDLQWTSNLTSMDLVIWQQYPQKSDNDFYYDYLLQDTRSTSLIWTVTLDGFSSDVRDGEDAIFYLALYESGVTSMDASSHYFNVSLPETTTSASATSTTTRQAGRPTTSAAEAETTTASSDPSSDDSSLSTGAVAGIAVGATVGGLLVLGALGFLAWKHFRKGDSGGKYSPGQQYPPPEMSTPGMSTPGWIQTPQGPTPVQQMPMHMQQQQQQQHVPAVYEAPTDHPKQGPVYEAP